MKYSYMLMDNMENYILQYYYSSGCINGNIYY